MERIFDEFLSKSNLGLQFVREDRGEAVIFHCRGAFSLGSYSGLDLIGQEIEKAHAKKIVLDMREVGHIDSTGMGTLASVLKGARGSGRSLLLVPSPPVRGLLATVQLDKVFPSFDSVDDALRSPEADPAAGE